LHHLKYFVDAVSHGSISGAAQKNLVTHSAISRAILSLEQYLDIPLLEHRKKIFKPTEAGYKVAEQAQFLLSAASDFEALSLETERKEKLEFKVGISKTLSEAYLNPLLRDLQLKFPSLKTKVRFGTTLEIVEAVAGGLIDLGLTIGSQNLATLRQVTIQKGKFILVEKKSKKNQAEKVEEKSFLITEPRSETEKLKALYQRQYSCALPVLYEIGSWEAIGQFVLQGVGVGLVPDVSVKNWRKGSFRILDSLEFRCTYEVLVHTSKYSLPNRVLEYVMKLLLKRR